MKGRFDCVFTGLTYIVVLGGILVVILTVPNANKGDLTAAVVLIATMCVVLPVGFLLGNIPCTYSANETSFTITVLGKTHRYRYSEIESISCEYGRTDRYGNAYAELTVKTRSGKTDFYTENCGMKMHEIMNDPASHKPQLMQLCEYVRAVRGETK